MVLKFGSFRNQIRKALASIYNTSGEELSLMLADYIITEVSDESHERQRRKKYSHKLLPYGKRYVDLDLFRPIIPYHQRKNRVGFIGRLEPGKGALEATRAGSLIINQIADAEILIVGSGLESELVKKELREMGDNAVFLERVDHTKIPLLLNSLRLLLIPSKEEGLPTILAEALACGTPVLGTNIGAMPEILNKIEEGFIFQDTSPETIASMTTQLLLREEYLQSVSSRCREYAERDFSMEAARQRFTYILERASEGKMSNEKIQEWD